MTELNVALTVVGSLTICPSVLVHGVSAAPLTNLYARHFQEVER